MSRIEKAFALAHSQGRGALIVYICAGDPDLEAARRIVPKLVEAGADIIELGIPFSDPLADGPVIQAASQRALSAGTTLPKVLKLVGQLREDGVSVPLVLMGYLNPIIAMGFTRFSSQAREAGVDGLIVPDLPCDESEELGQACAGQGIDLVLLAAPSTPRDRLELIAQKTRGFLYFVSVTGVTGERSKLPADLPEKISQARAVCSLPVAVGFGISTPAQAEEVAKLSQNIIVGSALVRALAQDAYAGDAAAGLIRSMRAALVSAGFGEPQPG